MNRDQWLQELREQIPEISPQAAREAVERGDLVLVDVRDPDEHREANIEAAVHLPRGFLELRAASLLSDRSSQLVTFCKGGVRSLFAAEALKRLGYDNVHSMVGGFDAWRAAGLPFAEPRVLSTAEQQRYARQTVIPEVGEHGQGKLLDARVLLVGAGGLGSPVGLYLAAAGVGHLGIIDFDVVEMSNLQRQILHPAHSVGQPKVDSARATIKSINPTVHLETYNERLDSTNAKELFQNYDIIVDGSDNFETRYLVNDVCVDLGIPNVHGSIFRFDGQVTVFWSGRGPCYRCLYAAPPPPELAPS